MIAKRLTLLAPLFVFFLAVTSISVNTLAQSDDIGWATPENLSHSGAASSPVIVVVPDGTLRIVWWDDFEGLMVAEGAVPALRELGNTPDEPADGEGWSAPSLAPILLPKDVTREDGTRRTILAPIEFMPLIVGDTAGRAHAFWLGEPDRETRNEPLLYSRLAPGSTSWSSPATLADAAASLDATADISGTVHLAYVQPVQIARSPSGMYYRRSRNAGAWSTATAIQQSRYLRLLPVEGDSISMTADDSESVYITWDDPRTGQGLLTHSADGGGAWQEPRPLTSSDGAPLRNQVITLPGQPAPILWKAASQDQSILAVNSAGDALLLSIWDGARWSETRRLALHLQDAELGGPLYLSDLQLALAAAPPDQEQAGQVLIVVGQDLKQDLWVTGIQAEALERLFYVSAELAASQTEDSQGGAPSPVPVNLSRSGVASSPAILAGSDGTLRAFWWDEFDGLTVADGAVLATSVLSGTQEVVTLRESWSEPRPVPLPSTTTPRILADAKGRVHAFWIQEPTREQITGVEAKSRTWPLMYSRLASDATAWLSAVTLAPSAVRFDVAADASGALHVAYVQAVDTASSPAGVYYRHTVGEGTTWLAPVALDQSRYLRILTPETAYLRLAADDAGGVYVTWDDPHLEELLLAYSPNGGVTWQTPERMVDAEGQPQRGQLLAVPRGETLLLWQDQGSGAACSLYQARAIEVAAGNPGAGEPVLQGMAVCPDNARFLPLGEGQALMVVGSGSDSLTLVVWDGEQWSEPSRVSYNFEDPETDRQVYLVDLRPALVGLPQSATEGMNDHALITVGTDAQGDVWATSGQMGTLDLVFAPPPPWSAPVNFAESQGLPGLPAVAFDSEDRLHVLWDEESEGGAHGASLLYARRDEAPISSGTEVRWIDRTEILRSPEGGADQPSLAAEGDLLHAIWRAGQDGQIFHSQAFASDAYAASGWNEPQALPAPAAAGSRPDVAVDLGGSLHVVYAVPVNEGRGIYYARSEDGTTWSAERQVFDAAGAGWAMSDYPRLAADLAGTIHVIWVRADPFGSGLIQTIYYAQSVDGGETWSEPLEVAEGAFAWPEVIASGAGQVHLLWNEATGENAWWHQWSADGGLGWTRPERVPGFGNVPGPGGMMSDGTGMLHIVGLGRDDRGDPALLYVAWNGQRWAERELFRLDLAKDTPVTGVSAALLPASGQLDVVFRGKGKEVGEAMHTDLWHTRRAVPAVVAVPVPTFTPRPTPAPLPTPVPTIIATSTPSFSTAPPQSSGGSMADLLPLLLPGGLAAVIVAGAFGAGLLVRARRNR